MPVECVLDQRLLVTAITVRRRAPGVQGRHQLRVREHAHAAVTRRGEDSLSGPAEGQLVRLHRLLVRRKRRGLAWREDEEVVGLVAAPAGRAVELAMKRGASRCGLSAGPVSGRTLFPTIRLWPSGAQTRVNASPSPLISLTHVLVLTSQNLTTPSLLTEQSSASLTGLKAILSMGAEWPLSSVEKRMLFFSGFPELHRC